MKTIPLTLVCLALLTAGCTTARIGQKPLAQVAADYRSIHRGMTQDEVVARLGAPDNTDKAGNLHWKQEQDSNNYAELTVAFDGDGRVVGRSLRSVIHSAPADADPVLTDPVITGLAIRPANEAHWGVTGP